jgi:putative FmdB family regulatory protein
MPSYEYVCDSCGASMTETYAIAVEFAPPTCPNPNCKETMTRVYSSPIVTFKGDGWGKDPN